MKQLAISFATLTIFTISTAFGQGPNRVARELQTRMNQRSFTPVQPFALMKVKHQEQHVPTDFLRQYELLELDLVSNRRLSRSSAEVISLVLPYQKSTITVDLFQVETDPTQVITSEGRTHVSNSQHFRGIVRGDDQSLVSISISDEEMMGIISSNDLGNVVLGHWPEMNSHVIYSDSDLSLDRSFSCGALQVPSGMNKIRQNIDQHSRSQIAGCTDIYLEVGHDVYVARNRNVSSTESFISGIFNQVATIYANEGITIKMSQLFVWTRSDPYSGSAEAHLDKFMAERRSYNGDLAHLITVGNGNGGIAYVDVLCSSNFGYGYSDIGNSYSAFPNYSWSVNVLAHELGHNFGSQHTHACAWGSSGNQALDNCFSTEGSCAPGPAPQNGGTIMSYCHLKSTGVNFNNGFGTEPGNLIRRRANAASCLGNCGGGNPTCNLEITGLKVTPADCGQSNGEIEVNVNGANGSTTYTLGGTTQGSNVFTGLAPGNYTAQVSNGGSCSRQQSAAVTTSESNITLEVDIESATCNEANGSITIGADGGTGPYTFVLDGKSQNNGSFSKLEEGEYEVMVSDAAGCSVSETHTVEGSDGPTLSSNIDDTSCGDDNGKVTLSAAGGAGSYTYGLGSQSNTSGIFENLPAGTYNASVSDNNNCASTSSIQIKGSEGISATVEVTATECGEKNGRLEVQAEGGTGSLRYSVGGSFQSNPVFTELDAGTYVVRVRDQRQCEVQAEEEIESSQGYQSEVEKLDTRCGDDNGSLEVSVAGTTGPYAYKVNSGAYGDQRQFEKLPAGHYTITVRDTEGCETKHETEIKASSPIASDVGVNHTSCGEDNGALLVNATGGVGSLDIRINSRGRSVTDLDNLPSGTYLIEIIDDVGCSVVHEESIDESAPLELATTIQSTTCNQENGSITLDASSLQGPYEYRINEAGFSSQTTFSDLPAGEYRATARDVTGCTIDRAVVVEASEAAQLDIAITHTTCNRSNGELILKAASGTGPFRFTVGDLTDAEGLFSNLDAGSYQAKIEDAVGCVGLAEVFIEPSEDVVVSTTLTGTTCGRANGSLVAIAEAGEGPFSFLLNASEQSNGDFDQLAAGEYELRVTDQDDCMAILPLLVEASNGIDFAIEPKSTTCGALNGSITIEASGGTGTLQYSIGEAYGQITAYADLPPSTYSVSIRDEVGCVETEEVNIDASTNPSAQILAQPTRCGEENGKISLEIAGGEGPYQISLNGVNTAGMDWNELAPGAYAIDVTDVHGCQTDSIVNVLASSRPVLAAISERASCYQENGQILIEGSAGIAPYEYSIGDQFQSDARFEAVDSGLYLVSIRDADACTSTTEVYVAYDDQFQAPELALQNSLCDGEAIVLNTGLPTSVVHQWEVDGRRLDEAGTPMLTASQPGLYRATVAYHESCVLSTESTLTVHEKPQQQVPTEVSLCRGEAFTLKDLTEGYAYAWNNGTMGPEVLFASSGTYTLSTTNEFNCSVEGQIEVEVIQPVVLETDRYADVYTCSGSDALLQTSGTTATAYTWFSSDGDTVSTESFHLAAAESGATYMVIGSNSCFTDSTIFQVALWSDETVHSQDTTIVEGAPLLLTVKGGSEVSWSSTFDQDCSACDHVFIRPEVSGTMYLDYLDNHGCAREAAIQIDVVPLADVLPELINVMTPNSDGMNDMLAFPGLDKVDKTSISIYDQEGKIIYRDAAYANNWTGHLDGSILPQGVYFYVVAFALDDRVFEFDSSLTILRN
ncbi:MAG: gliding motility-associated C-terminal domain-containing protein [Saprospiraceae bacterium]|nr:gliding motility-associated C-terminal domain-containing protein [Saprospiraceae bacterium]